MCPPPGAAMIDGRGLPHGLRSVLQITVHPDLVARADGELTEEERWHVVNYVRTLAKDKQ